MGFIDNIETILAGTPPERQTALFLLPPFQPIRRLADRYMHTRSQSPSSASRSLWPPLNSVVTSSMAGISWRLHPASSRWEEITSALILYARGAATGELAPCGVRAGSPPSLNAI